MKLETIQKKYPKSATFKFGDNETLCQRILELVREGKKTATCEDLRVYDSGHEELPTVGRKDIALNWNDSPAVVIETVEVTYKKFCDVDEVFALEEGENESLEGWRHDHKIYFERNGGFDNEMMLMCERFKIVEVI